MPLIVKGQKDKERIGHCSWCFKKTKQSLVTAGGKVLRAVYRCENCQKPTLTCRTSKCEAFTRDVPGYSEKYCYVCRKIIQSWDDEGGINALNPTRYCSCCFEKAQQRVVVINIRKTKYTYECMNCHEATKPCVLPTCKEFAAVGQDKCSKCKGEIKDWSNVQENKASNCRSKLCSWCLSETNHAIRNHEKNIFQCLSCHCPTAPCPKCGDCMTAASSCVKCLKADALPMMMIKKKKHDKIYESMPLLRQEMKRSSDYSIRALREGLIRPFLSLVSMHPQTRAQVGFCLSIVLSTKDDYFLDAHGEAYILLFDANRGIQARSMGAKETWKVGQVDWFIILSRVMKDQVPQEKWMELPPDTLHASVTPGNGDMLRLESLLVNFYLEQQSGTLSDIAKQNLKLLMGGPEFEIYNTSLKDSIYYKSDMDVYTKLQLCRAFQQSSLVNRDTLLTQEEVEASTIMTAYSGLLAEKKTEANQNSFISSSVAVANAVGNIGTNVAKTQIVSFAFPILGMAVLAGNIGTAAYGETLKVVIAPVREIILQKALLLARGMSVDEFVS